MNKVAHLFLGALLLACWRASAAAETPEPEPKTPPAPPPSVIEVELPAAFTEAASAAAVAPPPKQSTPSAVSTAEILPYEMEVGINYSRLNNGFVDWTGIYVDAEMKLAPRNNIYASIRQANRYGKEDTEYVAGFYDPIDDHFTVAIETTMSLTHHVLPWRSFLGQIDYLADKGWAGGVGWRHVDYTNAELNTLTSTLERSWGNYRAAYTRYQGFLIGVSSVGSNQVQFARYYGDRDWVGLTFSQGKELETTLSNQVLRSDVRTFAITGRHWIQQRRALTYSVGNYRQGNFYIRNGVQLGLRQQF